MRYILVVVGLILPIVSFAQSTNAPLNPDYYHWIERYEIKSGKFSKNFFSQVKPYKRSDIAAFIDSIRSSDMTLSRADEFNLTYLTNDNWEWSDDSTYTSRKPILKHFYRAKSDLFHVDEPDFDLHINPVLHLGTGFESESDANLFVNTRGVEVRGVIDKKLGFYSYIGENQVRLPFYVQDRVDETLVVPNEGFWKDFKEDGYDFFTARGYISFEATKSINLQFGHDRFNIGNGHRSLILSDFAPAYLFLKVNTKVWKLNYMNLFTQKTADVDANSAGTLSTGPYPDKYVSLHHLSINITDNLNIGVFESVIFGSEDSTRVGDDFDPNYLNPVIFFRAVEQQKGSPHNVLLGADFKWFLFNRISLYGQFVLDEFLLDRVTEGRGWWGNKFSAQFGGKYIDAFGIPNLDLQGEYNVSRPYNYSHNTSFGSYSHYRQPLAHPLGANFREFIGIARYQPTGRLNLTGKLIYANYGTDTTGLNVGTNILLDNTTRNNGTGSRDFNNEIAQGIGTDLLFLDLTASYQLRHNLFIDVKQVFRDLDSELDERDQNTSFTSVSLRWNIPQRVHEF
ncbi:MAG: hypothetical protein AAFX87_23205 [Bacteroidota bacterium]